MEQKTFNGEINLLELLAKFYLVLKNNKLLTILLPVLGLLTGVVASNFTKEVVKSSMMVETDLISEDESKFLMEQLNKADSIQGLSKEQERKIGGIEYEVKKGERIEDSVPVYIKISTVTGDKAILPVLQKALVNYLNQTEPIERNRTDREHFYHEMITRIDEELAGLTGVKKEINDKTKATFLEPADLFASSVELYDKRTKYEIALESIKSVHVVKNFGSLVKNAKWSKTLYALVGFVAGIFTLFAVLFLRFFHHYSAQIEKTKQG